MDEPKNDTYKQYLEELHAKNTTPQSFMEATIKRATGKKAETFVRIIAGEANEVYRVSVESGEEVILRISRSEKPDFLQEKWAIDHARIAGVPVPDILLLQHTSIGNQPLSLCVQQKIEGEPLERGKIDVWNMSEKELRPLINQAGAILTKIHTVPTQGFEYIDGSGKGEYPSYRAYLKEEVEANGELQKMEGVIGMQKGTVASAISLLIDAKKLYDYASPRLNHADFGPKHFILKDGKINGIIDWGEASSDFPVLDFAKWDYWYGDSFPLEWLKEGYENQKLFTPRFDELLLAAKVRCGLTGLYYMYGQGYKPGIEKAKGKLEKLVLL